MELQVICKNCGKKFKPIFENHIYNGSEKILHGNETVVNGTEFIHNSNNINIENYFCPYCGTKYKSGIAKQKS